MASLMCVDIDLNPESEETDVVNEASNENETKSNIEEVLESEIRNAVENGDGIVKWLELDELEIDDDKLLSLSLSTKFPVRHSKQLHLYIFIKLVLKAIIC